MNRLLLPVLAACCLTSVGKAAAPELPRMMLIAVSTTKAGMAQHATLTVQPLKRQADHYVGSYGIVISPLGMFSETGTLEVRPPADMAQLFAAGKPAEFKGNAKSDSGKPRTIKGLATPAAADHGTVHLEIHSERGKMRFDTTFSLP